MGRAVKGSKKSDRVQLWLREGLKDRLIERTIRSGGSINSEIIDAIEAHLGLADDLMVRFDRRIEDVERRLGLIEVRMRSGVETRLREFLK